MPLTPAFDLAAKATAPLALMDGFEKARLWKSGPGAMARVFDTPKALRWRSAQIPVPPGIDKHSVGVDRARSSKVKVRCCGIRAGPDYRGHCLGMRCTHSRRRASRRMTPFPVIQRGLGELGEDRTGLRDDSRREARPGRVDGGGPGLEAGHVDHVVAIVDEGRVQECCIGGSRSVGGDDRRQSIVTRVREDTGCPGATPGTFTLATKATIPALLIVGE